jgi:RHS repeat-associated protein
VLWTGSARRALPSTTAPGSNAVFSFNVTAPSTPGTYNFQWKMVQDGVEWFGALSPNQAIRVGLDNAAFVSQSVPSSMIAGQNYAVSVTMQNTGSTTWPAGTVLLGSQNAQDNMTWGLNRIALTTPVAPGATRTINFTVTAPSAPGSYNFQWKMLEGPSYWFGAQSTNVAVNVTPSSPDANVFFIHTDHLNTPRLVANSSGTTVWRWDQQEPFGVNAPDPNPSGLGSFEFNLRFPGQYADKETNLFYNYFRDYDSSLGRYVQSDPTGLKDGPNTYAYVSANPLMLSDPNGLGKWDNFYNLPKAFWKWLHREDGGKLIKELKDPKTGQVPKDVAEEYYKFWQKEKGIKDKQSGFADPDFMSWLIPWWLTPRELACAELDCNRDGVPDHLERYRDICRPEASDN